MTQAASTSSRRAYWLKTLHEWHWVSSAVCLVGMLLFALTGFTLNHAGQIEAKPEVVAREGRLPEPLLKLLQPQDQEESGQNTPGRALPQAVQEWARAEFGADVRGHEVEWSEDEAYVAMPRPGGDAWLRLSLLDGQAEFESTDRGWISYFNDLHKGRHAGAAWGLFIDIFALACLVFCLTGLFILQMHAGRRPMTWPMVGLGLLIPALLALLLVH
ncbi:PepSY-associated TM helix domain-containing protein [Comamonas composti]|uniref:PepSY-associated TM helix domain-containing protein n=1 Tax=Comamonas composti TaxID=408558 RepID=UPI000478D6CC|nr:PepSY-associated TM helix domain-containing protein [Comamonas composti]